MTENLPLQIILAVPIFLIVVWLTGKFIKRKQYKYITAAIITILLTPIIYIGAVAVFFSILFHEPTKKFDKKVWLSDTTKRFQMADNIVYSKLLLENDTNQIKQLLGNPTWRNDSLSTWTYNMGTGGGGLGFLLHYLNISFVGGKAIKVDHLQVKD
jgi:hypothetical protein